MIGVRKRIIVFDNEGTYMIMFNPEIIKKSGPYDTEEGVFPCSETPANANAIRRLECSCKLTNSKPASKPLLVKLRRLFSMKSTIVMGY